MPDQELKNDLQVAGQAAGQETSLETSAKSFPQPPLKASGWILTLALVGLWIGAGQVWRRNEPKLRVTAAEYTVDINQASERDLLNLPEVGPSLAKKILSYREQHGDFHSLSDLSEVPGVGPQTLKLLRPFLSFPTPSDAAIDAASDETILTAQSRERIAP